MNIMRALRSLFTVDASVINIQRFQRGFELTFPSALDNEGCDLIGNAIFCALHGNGGYLINHITAKDEHGNPVEFDNKAPIFRISVTTMSEVPADIIDAVMDCVTTQHYRHYGVNYICAAA